MVSPFVAHQNTAVTGGLGAHPLDRRASTALATLANCWGLDVGFLCNNDGSLQLGQWVQMENGRHSTLGMPLIPQGENVVQVSVDLASIFVSYNAIIYAGFVENILS